MTPTDIAHEEQLITAAQEDLNRFEDLYDLYFRKVYGYFISRINNRATAEDMTSQTFLKALEGFGNYRFDGKPFGAWLFRIAHNLRVDFYRQQKAPLVDLEQASGVQSKEDVANKVHTKMLYEQVEELLNEFDAEEKEIILLKLSSGLKFREIAKIMGKSESTIKSKYFRTLKNLQGKADALALLLTFISYT